MFAVHPLGGVAGEKQIADVKEIAGAFLGRRRGFPPLQANNAPVQSWYDESVSTSFIAPTKSAVVASIAFLSVAMPVMANAQPLSPLAFMLLMIMGRSQDDAKLGGEEGIFDAAQNLEDIIAVQTLYHKIDLPIVSFS